MMRALYGAAIGSAIWLLCAPALGCVTHERAAQQASVTLRLLLAVRFLEHAWKEARE